MQYRTILGIVLVLLALTGPVGAWTPPDYESFSATHTAVAVATTSTQVVALKTTRNFLLLENISDTAIDCKIGAAAVASEGIRLAASNGALLLDKKYPTAAVNCLHAGTGTKTLLVTEGTN